MHAVHGLRVVCGIQVLQLPFDVVQGVGVEQVAQLRLAEQLAQLRLVDREGLRATFGERRVAVVDVVGDVPEEQGGGKRRRHRRVDRRRADLAPFDPTQCVHERRDVEDVPQALPVRLEEHGERPEPRGDRQEIGGSLALLPERTPAAGTPPRQEQRARGRFAELRREERRRAELPDDERLDFLRGGNHQLRIGRVLGLREPHHEPVVGPHGLDVEARLGARAFDDGHRPGGVDAAAERRQHADAPVAELVAAAFDHDGAVVGHGAGGFGLIGEIPDEVFRSLLVEIVMADEALDRG